MRSHELLVWKFDFPEIIFVREKKGNCTRVCLSLKCLRCQWFRALATWDVFFERFENLNEQFSELAYNFPYRRESFNRKIKMRNLPSIELNVLIRGNCPLEVRPSHRNNVQIPCKRYLIIKSHARISHSFYDASVSNFSQRSLFSRPYVWVEA